MRIGTQAPRTAAGPKRSTSTAKGGAFLPTGTQAEPAGPTTAPAPVLGVDALLSLQADAGGVTATEAALRHGNDLLRHLEDLHRDLVDGRPSRASLAALQAALDAGSLPSDDPRLDALVKDIEVRAAVEMAKRERADGYA